MIQPNQKILTCLFIRFFPVKTASPDLMVYRSSQAAALGKSCLLQAKVFKLSPDSRKKFKNCQNA